MAAIDGNLRRRSLPDDLCAEMGPGHGFEACQSPPREFVKYYPYLKRFCDTHANVDVVSVLPQGIDYDCL